MRIRFMLHKAVSLVCFIGFILMHLVHEGYPQTQIEQGVSVEEQKEGRTLLVVSATMTGLTLYGPGTARLLDIESGAQVAGLEMLIGGGSFVGALVATKNHRLGAGRSSLILSGSLVGTLYGFGVPVLFESENDKAYFASAMIATPIGGLIAHRLSSHRWFNEGESHTISRGGLVGGLYGIAIPYLINIEDLEDWTQSKIYVTSAMIGVPAGVWTTAKLIYDKPINEGRASLISLGGGIGSAYALGILSLTDVEEPRPYVLAAMLGLPVGTYLGYKLTVGGEYTSGRAALIQVGAYAGALFGSGFPLMADAESHKPYVVASILGSAAGMWFAHRLTRGWGESAPFARNNLIPTSDRFTVSLPSINEWFTLGMMALRKPTFMADFPVELVRISF
jgi:hypothetical protein